MFQSDETIRKREINIVSSHRLIALGHCFIASPHRLVSWAHLFASVYSRVSSLRFGVSRSFDVLGISEVADKNK
jgi:hypothetical protein